MTAAARADAGRKGPPIVGILQNAFVTGDPERDWPMVRDGIGHQLGVYTGWRNGTDVPGRPLEVQPPDEQTIRRTTAYGTPDDVVAFLEPVVDILSAYPESHLVLRLHYPGMDAEPASRAIALLGGDVAPRLKARS